jgi:RNA polymerase sigma-70 factor (ECF subfamily)
MAEADLESTVQLIERARQGDGAALDRLVARHLTPLRRWARGRLPAWARDVADTDDIVQDTLLRTVKSLDGFEARRPGALLAYLREAVLNRVRDEIRRTRRLPEDVTLDEREPDAGRSPLEEAIGAEAIGRYQRALDALEPGDREVIIGRVEMGYTYEELAEALGKPSADAARKAAKRALVRLIERMDAEER